MKEELIESELMKPVFPNEPESPIMAHIKMLLCVAKGKIIPDDVKEAVLSFIPSGRERTSEILESEISLWNERIEVGILTYLFRQGVDSFKTDIARSYGDLTEENFESRKKLIEEGYIRFVVGKLSPEITNE